jgi:V/A-type H+-transporting ATPase subunit F
MKIVALCDNDTAVGLRLAGINEIYISEENEISLWNKISERDDIGIIFINEKIAKNLDKTLREYRLINDIPIIIEIPDKKGRIKDHVNFVSQLIKKAVGVEVGV